MEDYLQLLEESLIKKIGVLDKIGEFNKRQKDIFSVSEGEPDFDRFDSYVEEKGKLIDELNSLDEGFESLYDRVSETLKKDREANADRIRRLQNLIREITDKSVSLQSQEIENKKLMDAYFIKAREGIGKGRVSLNAAYSYYQTQRSMNGSDPLYLDSKQ